MRKDEKIQVVEEFVGIFGEPGFYLVDFKGLNVAEITELRALLRQANVSMRVVKNTLALRALKEAGIAEVNSYLVGPTGVVWSSEDSVAPVKVLIDFLKKYEKGSIKAGMVDGVLVEETDMGRLAKLPGKQELYAQVASALNMPMTKLARTLNAMPAKFARTLGALEKKRTDEAA